MHSHSYMCRRPQNGPKALGPTATRAARYRRALRAHHRHRKRQHAPRVPCPAGAAATAAVRHRCRHGRPSARRHDVPPQAQPPLVNGTARAVAPPCVPGPAQDTGRGRSQYGPSERASRCACCARAHPSPHGGALTSLGYILVYCSLGSSRVGGDARPRIFKQTCQHSDSTTRMQSVASDAPQRGGSCGHACYRRCSLARRRARRSTRGSSRTGGGVCWRARSRPRQRAPTRCHAAAPSSVEARAPAAPFPAHNAAAASLSLSRCG